MEARKHKRVIVNLSAELICGDKRYAGTIENLSENGAYVVTAPQRASTELTPDTLLDLKVQMSHGETQVLHCRIKWSYMTPPHGFTNSIGMEILDPPLKFRELLASL